jgi:hypothetical protein
MLKRAGLAKTTMASREVLRGSGVATRVWFFRGSLVLDSSFQRGNDHAARPSLHHAARRAWWGLRADAEANRTRQDKRFAMRMLLIVLSAAVAIMSVGLAAAEEARTPPVRAAAAAEASVPKLDCSRPQLPQQLPTAAEEAGNLTKQVNSYAACATRYVNERRAQAQRHGDLAKEEADAGNAAAKEINEFFASAKQLVQKGKEKAAN